VPLAQIGEDATVAQQIDNVAFVSVEQPNKLSVQTPVSLLVYIMSGSSGKCYVVIFAVGLVWRPKTHSCPKIQVTCSYTYGVYQWPVHDHRGMPW